MNKPNICNYSHNEYLLLIKNSNSNFRVHCPKEAFIVQSYYRNSMYVNWQITKRLLQLFLSGTINYGYNDCDECELLFGINVKISIILARRSECGQILLSRDLKIISLIILMLRYHYFQIMIWKQRLA